MPTTDRYIPKTTEYCIEVPAESIVVANELCNELKVRCPVPVAGSSVRRDPDPVAYVRFRAEGDEQAVEFARQMSDADGRVLHTGYGAHRRVVEL